MRSSRLIFRLFSLHYFLVMSQMLESNIVESIYRQEALTCYIVTMHMGKTMRISNGVATGCLNSESMFVHISYFLFCLVCCKSLFFSVFLYSIYLSNCIFLQSSNLLVSYGNWLLLNQQIMRNKKGICSDFFFDPAIKKNITSLACEVKSRIMLSLRL